MAKRGLGSDKMSQADKDAIHKLGGQSSHGGGRNSGTNKNANVTTNNSGGGRLTQADKAKGGRASQGGGR